MTTPKPISTGTYYVSIAYVRGPVDYFGPIRAATPAQAEQIARQRADKTRAIHSAEVQAQ